MKIKSRYEEEEMSRESLNLANNLFKNNNYEYKSKNA
jgi:hypothetical protein